MSIDTIYKIVQFISNKWEIGYITPEEFNRTFNIAQINLFNFLIGNSEQYQYGSPKSRVGTGTPQRVSESLSPFFVRETLAVTSGEVTKPSQYSNVIAMRTTTNEYISRTESDRLSTKLKSVVAPISTTNALYVDGATTFYIYPTTGITSVVLDYYKKPLDANWAYTVVNGRPTFNNTFPPSVNPLWRDTDVVKVIGRQLKLLGVHLKDQEISQYANTIIQTGE